MYEGALQSLVDELGRLPGVGPKSAQRIAFHLVAGEDADARRLAATIVRVRETVTTCTRCFSVAEQPECRVCRDERRDHGLICVVEEARDVFAIERTREYPGVYHVLGGALSPLDGVGPDELRVAELEARVAAGAVHEIILAMNTNGAGEATAAFLSRRLAGTGPRVTRLASGLPAGGDLDYADEVTLSRAFAGRRDA
ncbi:MAG: recombination mediator RecR [Nitriliruptoraceae bacterium]